MVNDTAACTAATTSIKIMMRQIQKLWPREKGVGWNITKFHEQFHVPEDIQRHGNHMNVHTGPQEHNHICIKKAAKHTQLQPHKLDLQTGECIMDHPILQCTYD